MMTTLAQRFALLKNLKPAIKKGELAKACGVKPPSVSDWFSGETKSLKFESAVKAAALYGVSASWLFDGKGLMKPEPPPAISGSSPVSSWAMNLAVHFDRMLLTEEAKQIGHQAAMEMIRDLAVKMKPNPAPAQPEKKRTPHE